jgi:RNA polymerase sigma-32 factor
MPRPAGDLGTFEVYVAEIRRVPVLSREEERELARAYRERGDTRAGHRLVTANLRFVAQVARGYRSYGLRLADLVQEGNMGLMRALEGYDPERGIRLISYAVWWIKAYIHNHILRSWSMVKLGTTQAQRRLFFALARAQREASLRVDGPGTDESALAAVARRLRVAPAQVEQMGLRLAARDVSLDAPAGDGSAKRLDLLESDAPGPEDLVSGAEEAAFVAGQVGLALAALDERERAVVEMRVMSDAPMTLQALGESLGCTRERARQLEFRAKAKLRRALASSLPGRGGGAARAERPARRARPRRAAAERTSDASR